MTATDILRRLLDERGVEWRGGLPTETIVMEPFDAIYVERPDGRMHVYFRSYLTPAQAIDATLGPGTCHNMYTDDDEWFACSECNTELRVHEPFGVICNIRYCPNCGRRVIGDVDAN